MKYKGKRIAMLLTTGLLTVNTAACQKVLRYEEEKAPQTYDISKDNPNDVENQTHSQEIGIQEFQELLKLQFLEKSITLDNNCNKYVCGIYIDGINVSIELINGEILEGKLNYLCLNNIDLENLTILDGNFMTDLKNDTYAGYMEQLEEYDAHQKLELDFSKVSVHEEFKYYDNSNTDACFPKEDAFSCLDLSDCKKMWLHSCWVDNYLQERINEDQSLKSLIFTDSDFYAIDNILKLTIPSLETLIIEEGFIDLDNLNDVNLRACTGLKNLKLGANNTSMLNLNSLSGLTSLETVSFGQFPGSNDLDILSKSFEDKEAEIRQPYSVSDPRTSKSNNNCINDISGLKGSNIRVLNISYLFHVSSKKLYETVITLPHLQEIVGLPINNAEMCSEELIAYCDEHSIKHPFTEKSLLIKKELQRIVSELITDDMDDFEKIKALSKYIIENTQYYYKATYSDNPSQEEIIIAWGENLYWTVMNGIGLCAGYAEFTEALFTEANVTNFKQETVAHAYNLVKVDDTYYQIDLTNLDAYIDYLETPIDEYQFNINSPYYLIPVGEEDSYYSFAEPREAELQRKRLKEIRENANEANTTETQKSLKNNFNDKNKTSTNKLLFKIMGILIALGVAIPISKNTAELMPTLKNGKIKNVLSLEQLFEYIRRIQYVKDTYRKSGPNYKRQQSGNMKSNEQDGDER